MLSCKVIDLQDVMTMWVIFSWKSLVADVCSLYVIGVMIFKYNMGCIRFQSLKEVFAWKYHSPYFLCYKSTSFLYKICALFIAEKNFVLHFQFKMYVIDYETIFIIKEGCLLFFYVYLAWFFCWDGGDKWSRYL